MSNVCRPLLLLLLLLLLLQAAAGPGQGAIIGLPHCSAAGVHVAR